MKIEIKPYSNSSSLLSSIVFLILGAFLITNSDNVITWISYIVGSLLVLIGVIKLFTYYRIKTKTEITSNGDLIFGVIALSLGILCFFLAGVFETLIRFIIGAWILFSGVQRLIEAMTLETKFKSGARFIVLLVVSFLLIALGLYIILYSNLVFKWIGILMVVYSITEIIGYIFFYFKSDKEDKTKEKRKVIIEHKEKD